MIGDTVTVYVVTATHHTFSANALDERQRVDLAKFFVQDHADAHVKTLHKSWAKVAVEPREERRDEQHRAHAPDPFKKPPTPWK